MNSFWPPFKIRVGLNGGGPPPDPDPDPGDFARTASTNATMSIHSGHSLTDAYVHSGGFPGNLRAVLESVGITDAYDKVIKSTIPGSSLNWRWNNPVADGRPGNAQADARLNIAEFDMLMITEGGPPPRTTGPDMVSTLDYFCRFTANTIENGAGQEVILWSIWPSLDGPGGAEPPAEWTGFTFRTGLPEYERSFKFMADYASWKMRQLYPTLPSDWRVWMFPGHLWMERVWDDIQNDLVPGITDIDDLFADDIHPTPGAGYGLACLVASCMYQVNLTDAEDVWIMPAFTDAESREWPAVPQALAEYFWQIAWEIATNYEPIGMGGTDGAALEWHPSDGDPMPLWTLDDPDTGGGEDPDPEPGDLPEFAFVASADDLTDLQAMTGAQPTVEDGVLKFTGGEFLAAPMSLTDRYAVLAIKINSPTPEGGLPQILAFRDASTPAWADGGPWALSFNGWLNPPALGFNNEDSENSVGEYRTQGDVWHVLEMWTDAETGEFWVDGGAVGTKVLTAAPPESTELRLFPNSNPAPACEIAAIGICDHVPDVGGRAAARAWAQGLIPD